MQVTGEIADLVRLGNVVPQGYRYYEKIVRPGAGLNLSNAYLKWYDLYPSDAEITLEQVSECRAFIASEVDAGRLNLNGDLGFVTPQGGHGESRDSKAYGAGRRSIGAPEKGFREPVVDDQHRAVEVDESARVRAATRVEIGDASRACSRAIADPWLDIGGIRGVGEVETRRMHERHCP